MGDEFIKQGWDYITQRFEEIYPGQEESALYYNTLVSWRLGGPDPLDGIIVYDAGDCYHFVTLGFSELYEKESDNMEYSGYGYELTLKLKKNEVDETELGSIAGILQELGRITFEQGELFLPYEYIYTGQKSGMDSKGISKLTGFITVPDEQAGEMQTPNGKVEFVRLIGMTDQELLLLVNKKCKVQELVERLGTTETDFFREELELN